MKEKIKISIKNAHLKVEESKKPFFDLAIFVFSDSEPKIITMRRYLQITLDPFHAFWIGNKIEEPLRTYLLAYFNTAKLPL